MGGNSDSGFYYKIQTIQGTNFTVDVDEQFNSLIKVLESNQQLFDSVKIIWVSRLGGLFRNVSKLVLSNGQEYSKIK